METFRLERSGDVPLVFDGEKIAESGGRWWQGRDQNRWHEIAVYKTQGGRYLLEIHYRTQWQGEADHRQIIDCGEDPARIVAEFKSYDPAAHLIGYPVGKQYEDKQRQLVDSLTRRYRDQLTEIFRAFPDAEERIE